jgi:transposase
VLELYKKPYNVSEPIVCMDELNKQLKQSKAADKPVRSGRVNRIETRYERNGTCNIFLSFEPLAGKRVVTLSTRRRRVDWSEHIQNLVKAYPKAKKIILIVDNLNIHTGAALYENLPAKQAREILNRLEIHYTPKHGSWLNVAEIELSHLSRQCLARRMGDEEMLRKEVKAWCKRRNEECSVVDWQFTTQDARIKLKKLYPTICENVLN